MVDRETVFTKSIVQVALEPDGSTMRYWRRDSILSAGLGCPDQVEVLGVGGEMSPQDTHN